MGLKLKNKLKDCPIIYRYADSKTKKEYLYEFARFLCPKFAYICIEQMEECAKICLELESGPGFFEKLKPIFPRFPNKHRSQSRKQNHKRLKTSFYYKN